MDLKDLFKSLLRVFSFQDAEDLKTCRSEYTKLTNVTNERTKNLNNTSLLLDAALIENEHLDQIVAMLEANVQELASMKGVKTPTELEWFYEHKYPSINNGYHVARPLPTTLGGMRRIDIREFCWKYNTPAIRNIVETYDQFKHLGYCKINSGTDDEKMYKICTWVQKHIEYVSDLKQTNYSEYWLEATETLATREGDCVANYEEIYTPTGLKKVGELKEGDYVTSYDLKKK